MTETTGTQDQADVVVVGAGPTGLLLAAELALHGVDVAVLERLADPDTTIKAGSISVGSAEALDRRGLLPAARRAQQEMAAQVGRFAPGVALPGSGDEPTFPTVGHFAGMFFRADLVDQHDPGLRAHLSAVGATMLPQRAVEVLLGDYAVRLGVRVQRSVEVTDIEQCADSVTVHTSHGAIGARYVVGADGGRSVVRKIAGIDFHGTDAEITGYQAIAELDGAEQLGRGWTWTPHGVYCHGPIPGRVLTVQFTGTPADRTAPVTGQEIETSLRRVSGTDVRVRELHGAATRWTDNARQAATYRSGRILLAGDAAHVHSPFSGQGLNLGIGDATNLGWKLAAAVQGRAGDELLDSYTSERHPIAAWVLDWTRAQVALMRGDDKTAQLRDVTRNQLIDSPAGTTRMVTLTSGIAQRYDVDGTGAGSVCDGVDGPAQVGRLLGDIDLTDGTRLADHAHDGGFVLLDRSAGRRVTSTAAPWASSLTVVSDDGDGPSVLVRPDGVVAWADTSDASLPDTLLRWAGTPTGSL